MTSTFKPEACSIAAVSSSSHRRNQKQVDDPADEQQTSREEPDRAGDGLAVVKAVGAGEAKNPEHVADQLAVGLRWRVHNLAEFTATARIVQLQGPSTFV